MAVNLREDFLRRFGGPKVSSPKRDTTPPVEDDKPDLVVSTPLKIEKEKPQPTPSDWIANTDQGNSTSTIVVPSKKQKAVPVVLGNKQYRSEKTANWGAIRKAVYPYYKQICQENNKVPTIQEFTQVLGARWTKLSPDERSRAVENPSEFFVF